MAVEVAQEVKLFGKWSFDDVEVSKLPGTSSNSNKEGYACIWDVRLPQKLDLCCSDLAGADVYWHSHCAMCECLTTN